MTVMPLPASREHRGPLSTSLGKTWAERMRRADNHYEEHASRYCYRELLKLYTAVHELRNDWNANVSMGWSVLQNLVADSFFKNPEPVILPLTPSREEQARMLTDVGRSWHDTAGTEDNVKRARVLCGTMGGAVIWIEEDADYQDAPALDDDGNPLTDPETGEPWYELDAPFEEGGKPLKEAVRQSCTQTLIDLHGMRFDPDGQRWDWKDMKWVSRRYQRSLRDFLEDGSLSDITKGRLKEWAKSRRRKKVEWSHGRDSTEEKDPALLMIECDEIWSMVHGKIVHIPVGAEFHLEGATPETAEGFPMPEFWRVQRMYPGVMFAYNWHPPDADGRHGFYPIPDLYLVKSQLKNLIRLEGLILNLCTSQTTKYLVPDGLIDNKVQRRVASDVPRELISVDIVGFLKRLQGLGVQIPSNLENLIINLKTEQREQLIKHFEAFEHEVNIIRETLSQGPSQRAGVADSSTATGQLQVGQALQRRLDIEAEAASGFIDALTERYFMLLQARQTLPVYYTATGAHSNEQVFSQFVVDQGFRELRLAFKHRTGTARGIDRELLRAQIREAIQNALPVVQDPVQIQVLLKKLFATFDDPTLSNAFDTGLSQLAEKAAALQQALEMDQIGLEEAAPRLLEYLNAFVNAHMTQGAIERVAQRAGGGPAPAPEGGRTAPPPKAQSAGKRAYDTAAGLSAAGRVGGVG